LTRAKRCRVSLRGMGKCGKSEENEKFGGKGGRHAFTVRLESLLFALAVTASCQNRKHINCTIKIIAVASVAVAASSFRYTLARGIIMAKNMLM